MVSYMDVLTILLIFFVALAAQTVQKVPGASGETPKPASAPAPAKIAAAAAVPESRQDLLQAQNRLSQQGLDMHLEARGLVISLPQAILFASGDAAVSNSALPMVEKIADVLRDIPNPVSLVGHADAVPIHNRHFKSNWDLSTARGLSLLEVLSRHYGIPEARLSLASYGSYHPNSSNETSEGRAHNRRVEIVISSEAARPL